MKYSHEILINSSREEVVTKMKDPDNFKHWQEGFISYQHISGTPGEEGARAKLIYEIGKRNIEMTETILEMNLPSSFKASYEAKGVYNVQQNIFEEESSDTTRWISTNEFNFSGFMKIIGFFMPGSFKKQSLKYMNDFKDFAESGKSVLNG